MNRSSSKSAGGQIRLGSLDEQTIEALWRYITKRIIMVAPALLGLINATDAVAASDDGFTVEVYTRFAYGILSLPKTRANCERLISGLLGQATRVHFDLDHNVRDQAGSPNYLLDPYEKLGTSVVLVQSLTESNDDSWPQFLSRTSYDSPAMQEVRGTLYTDLREYHERRVGEFGDSQTISRWLADHPDAAALFDWCKTPEGTLVRQLVGDSVYRLVEHYLVHLFHAREAAPHATGDDDGAWADSLVEAEPPDEDDADDWPQLPPRESYDSPAVQEVRGKLLGDLGDYVQWLADRPRNEAERAHWLFEHPDLDDFFAWCKSEEGMAAREVCGEDDALIVEHYLVYLFT